MNKLMYLYGLDIKYIISLIIFLIVLNFIHFVLLNKLL